MLRELFGYERELTTGERLHLRMFETLVVCWTLYTTWEWAHDIPQLGDIVLPLGIARYIDVSFMFGPVAPVVNAVLITVLLALGQRWRPAYLLALCAFHLQYAARDVMGEISHGSNLIATAIAGLGLGGLLERDGWQARRFGFGFTVLFAGIGYTSAGICKLIATGPTWIDGRHLGLWITERSVDGTGKNGAVVLNLLQRLALEQRWLATAILGFGLIVELSAFNGWWRQRRPYAFGLLIGMHIGIWLTLDILFRANIWLLTVLAFPWDRWLERALATRRAVEPVLEPSASGAS